MSLNLAGIKLEEMYVLARYLYRVGTPIIPDDLYDETHEKIVRQGLVPEYTSRTYDDDLIPVDLLERVGYVSRDDRSEPDRDTSFLVEEKSKSIRKVDSMKEVYDFCKRFAGKRKVLSVKMDGNNIKSEVDGGRLVLSLTRGRASNGFDVTNAMFRIMPKEMDLPGRRVVVGEVFLPPEHLEYVRGKYGNGENYKTSKSAAISFIRRPAEHSEADYALLDFRAFACDGLADTVEGTFMALNWAGLNTPPYTVINELPDGFAEFEKEMTRLMDAMRERQIESGLPADGLVLELDDHMFETAVRDQYDDRQIALKFGHWSPSTYQGRITSVIVEQRRVKCCCKVTIEPILTDDGCEASTINVYNPSFLIDNGLTVGSYVSFERQSGTVNIMVGGKKIKTSAQDADE